MTFHELDPAEADSIARSFGVSLEQIRRDHLISHILAALGRSHSDELLFFGRTALARTHLVDGRLSEDIDLIALTPRAAIAAGIEKALGPALRRSHGRINWTPALTDAVRDTDVAVLTVNSGQLTVRIQLLNQLGYERWPTEVRNLAQRYSDAPPAALRVPTVESFAAWKTVAWHDRAAARDLYDLWALAERGHINAEAARLFTVHGPIAAPPESWMFAKLPSETDWRRQPAAQTRLTVTAAEAIDVVSRAWSAA